MVSKLRSSRIESDNFKYAVCKIKDKKLIEGRRLELYGNRKRKIKRRHKLTNTVFFQKIMLDTILVLTIPTPSQGFIV